MLYRPNFCCHCGEKVARARWLLWTSRRFCEFCQVEQMQHELLPKAGVLLALLIGAAGMVSYLGSNRISRATDPATNSPGQFRQLKEPTIAREKSKDDVTEVLQPPPANAPEATKLQRAARPEPSTEPVYYCGALTRKGTPCTRRLRTKGRCWQHIGQPSVEDLPKSGSRP
jgi:hypothetical protein